jgi:hypothetical protein
MTEEDNTHILFIDADIEFNPEDVIKLINANKDVVSAGYPQKWLSVDKIKEIFNREKIPQNPLELCTIQSVHIYREQEISELMRARYCTTGFLLIKREVIKKMMEMYPDRKYINDIDGYSISNRDYFYNLFTVEINKVTMRYESEDYGFSRLWSEIGGDIFIMTNISLKHYGLFGYSGNIYRQLVDKDNK